MAVSTIDPNGLNIGQYGNRNLLINSAMQVDQRNGGASVTPTSTFSYTIDRWAAIASVSSKFSVQQNAGSVTPPSGFSQYIGVTSLSAYTVGATETFALSQRIEGFNSAKLGWGASDAQTVSLSFWVRSSLTGTFGGSFRNSANDRSYPFSYDISAANTWEYKSVVVAGDTTGTWSTNNSSGVEVIFGLGSGATRSGTAGSWAGINYTNATGATSVVGTSGATFYLTGVQLEVGDTATPFEHRSYGQELALCQRYYWQQGGDTGVGNDYEMFALGLVGGTGHANVFVYNPVIMRAAPTFSLVSASNGFYVNNGSSAQVGGSINLDQSGIQVSNLSFVNTTTLTTGQPCLVYRNGTVQCIFRADAEL